MKTIHPLYRRLTIVATTFTLTVCLFVLVNVLIDNLAPAYAAQPAEPEIYECVQIAQANGIEVYRCLDEQEGNLFYVNQLGFMLVGQ